MADLEWKLLGREIKFWLYEIEKMESTHEGAKEKESNFFYLSSDG